MVTFRKDFRTRSDSDDLRIRVIGDISGGLSTGKAAQQSEIGKSDGAQAGQAARIETEF